MTLDEAKTIAMIMSNADGDCNYCANALLELFSAAFPQFEFRNKENDELIEPSDYGLRWWAFEVEVLEK